MRLPFLGRTWCLLATCSLTGCATFDGPFSHQTNQLNREDKVAQRQIEEANRLAKAGDMEGAKRILDRMNDDRGSSAGRASLRGTEYASSDIASGRSGSDIDEMIEELVSEEAVGTRDLRRKQYRSMSPALVRKIYREHLRIEKPAAKDDGQDEQLADNRKQFQPANSEDRTAPDPRHSEIHARTKVPLPLPGGQELPIQPGQPGPAIVPAVHFVAEAPKTVAQPSNIVLAGGIPPGGGVSLSGIEPLGQPANQPAAINNNAGPVIAPNTNKYDGPVITPGRPAQSQPLLSPPNKTIAGATTTPAPAPGNPVVPTRGIMGTNPLDLLNRAVSPESMLRGNSNPLFPQAGEPAVPNPIAPQDGSAAASIEQNPLGPAAPSQLPTSPATMPGATDPQKRNKPSVLSAAGVQNLVTSPLRGGMRAFSANEAPAPNALPAGNPDINSLIASLESQLVSVAPGASEAEKLDYVHKHVNLRLLYLVAGRNDQALEPIRNIEQTEQEFWQKLMWAISNYFDAQGMPHGADRATQTVTQLRAATQELKQVADLELRNLVFCDKIDAYGSYERTKRGTFAAGLNVLLYAEIDNFKSIAAQGDRYVTSLKSTVEFYKNQGDRRQVASIPFDTNQDFCRNKRRDYFLAYEFTIPQQLEPGTYTLVLRVEDLHGQKQATAKVNFVVE